MAFFPQDDRGKIFALIAFLALVGLWVQYDGGLGPVSNPIAYRGYAAQADTLNRNIDSLQAIVDAARRDLQSGSVETLNRRVAEYSAMVELLRRLVPTRNEVPTLIDDISTKAKVRGITLGSIEPLGAEPGSPFDTHRYRLEIFGHYDQIGEFLADIASLTRIVVPQEVVVRAADTRVQRFVGDTVGGLLTTTFLIRTFVKSATAATAGGTSGTP